MKSSSYRLLFKKCFFSYLSYKGIAFFLNNQTNGRKGIEKA